jgi:predicted Zn-dependent protease
VFPIYVCYDSYVTQAERYAIEQGMRETQDLFGCKVVCYGTNSSRFGQYENADQIVGSMMQNAKGQVNASILIDKLAHVSESWVDRGAIILVTGKDLYSQECNWCFGIARPSSRITAQSTYRYRSLSPSMAAACIKRTLRHEMGHIFCCPSSIRRSNTEMNLGLHCTNYGCSMRQTISVSALIEEVRTEDTKRCFCPQCMQDLRNFRSWYESVEKRGGTTRPRRQTLAAACGSATRRRV